MGIKVEGQCFPQDVCLRRRLLVEGGIAGRGRCPGMEGDKGCRVLEVAGV